MHFLHKTHNNTQVYRSVWGPHTKKHIDNTASIHRRGCAIHPKLLPPQLNDKLVELAHPPTETKDSETHHALEDKE